MKKNIIDIQTFQSC